MSRLTIQQRFILPAHPDEVWAWLVDPSRVVQCLPGATLEESSDDGRVHKGAVKVKVGAMTVAYRGTAEFVEVDETARRIRMEAKGRERTGSGSVAMTMVSEVRPADGGSEVTVEAQVQLSGKLVSFGRGMIEVVSEELFKDFTVCLERKLAANGGTEATRAAADPRAGAPAAVRERDAPGTAEPADAAPLSGVGFLFRVLRRWLGRLLGRR